VNLDFLLCGDALVDEELENVATVVALQLDDGTPLRVRGRCSVAAPSFLKVARQLAHVEVFG